MKKKEKPAEKVEPKKKGRILQFYPNDGRPTKYRPEFCQVLIDLVSKGYSYEAFAGYLKVAVATIYNWEKEHPEFLEAKKIASSITKYVWEGHGIDGLYDDTEYCPKTGRPLKRRAINSAVWIFNAKNRMGWRDKIEEVQSQEKPIVLGYDPKKKLADSNDDN